jgi:hypothetical protein
MVLVTSEGEAMADSTVLELTRDNWQKEVVFGDQPMVVEFWAPG